MRRRGEEGGGREEVSEGAKKREKIIRRAALEFKNGMYGILTQFDIEMLPLSLSGPAHSSTLC